MKIKQFEFNPISENTYVVYDDSNECVIIDAGCFYHEEQVGLLDFIVDNDMIVKHLINTHLHFDHVFGNVFLEEQLGLLAEANEKDCFLLEKMPEQMKMFGISNDLSVPKIGVFLKESDMVRFGNEELIVLEVPGHSPGSLAFYNEKEGCLFSGDVLFRGSIGRTDLEGGDFAQLIDAIKTKLFILPLDTVVYPGHGPSTTIGYEMRNNSYLNDSL